MNNNREIKINLVTLLLLVQQAISLFVTFFLLNNDEDEDDEIIFFSKQTPPRIKGYYAEVIPRFNDQQFKQNFRLTEVQFEEVLKRIVPSLMRTPRVGGPVATCPRLQFLSVIWLLATPESFRSVGCRFDMAKSTLHESFVRVLVALNGIASVMIRWPTRNERSVIKKKFGKNSHFKGVIGAIDGTYIPIKAPKKNPEVYVNRKSFHAITLQAITSYDLKFLDCFCGYPSSVSDSRIFKNSDIHKLMIESPGSLFSCDEYILGDKAYPNAKFCVPPFVERGRFREEHKNFNFLHAQTRQVVERSFAMLFCRWRRLQYLDMSRLDLICLSIIACCVLHNVCLTDDKLIHNVLEKPGRNFQRLRIATATYPDSSTRDAIFLNFITRNILPLRK